MPSGMGAEYSRSDGFFPRNKAYSTVDGEAYNALNQLQAFDNSPEVNTKWHGYSNRPNRLKEILVFILGSEGSSGFFL